MAISETRIKDFSNTNEKAIREWLTVAIDRYFAEGGGSISFAPFELFFARAETPAAALAEGINKLPANARAKFNKSLAAVVRMLPPARGDVWVFVAELVWRVDASIAVDEMERRFNEAFLDEMSSKVPGAFEIIVGYIRNSTFTKKRALAKLLRRIVSSSHFNDAQTRLTLIRLCEIDPDNWTAHMGLTRDHLHKQMVRIRERQNVGSMLTAQEELAEDIFSAIGFDRFVRRLWRLRIIPDAPYWLPTDNWIWRALAERMRLVVPLPNGHLAPAARRTDVRSVRNQKLTGYNREGYPARAETEEESMIVEALGYNSWAPSDIDFLMEVE
jgi:hypothetical protein